MSPTASPAGRSSSAAREHSISCWPDVTGRAHSTIHVRRARFRLVVSERRSRVKLECHLHNMAQHTLRGKMVEFLQIAVRLSTTCPAHQDRRVIVAKNDTAHLGQPSPHEVCIVRQLLQLLCAPGCAIFSLKNLKRPADLHDRQAPSDVPSS